MLEIKNVTKNFGEKKALNSLSFNIPTGSIFGLIGSNGSGKSTLLRVISGVYEPTVANLSVLYKSMYPSWSDDKFRKLACMFPININDRIINMSKGMQRQAALMLALSVCPKYLMLDEIFDGLDPVVRQLIKKLLVEMVTENESTIIIASHNLRELEDVCDHIGLIHSGGIVLEKELDEAKLGIHRVQIVFDHDVGEGMFQELNVVKIQRQGKLINLTIKGDGEQIEKYLRNMQPVYMEMLPLTLEEVFISEMEVVGYDINNIIQ